MSRITKVAICVLSWVSIGQAATINVPDDEPTIQAGIDATANGDTVLVSSGTYTGSGNHGISIGGKVLTLMSQEGPTNTVIDGEGNQSRAISIDSSDVSVQGFTIQNSGGAIAIQKAFVEISDCRIERNRAPQGGGIRIASSSVTINECIIYDNQAGPHPDGGWGGGIFCTDESSLALQNCTVFNNEATGPIWDGHGIVLNASDLYLTQCILWDQVSAGESDIVAVECCNINQWQTQLDSYIGVNGNFSANPLFCDTLSGDLAISTYSSCSPQYSPCSLLVGAADPSCAVDDSICCLGSWSGNINCDGLEQVDISDLTGLVNHLFVTFDTLCCPGECNINGDHAGDCDISDLTALVNHLFVTFEPLADCQ